MIPSFFGIIKFFNNNNPPTPTPNYAFINAKYFVTSNSNLGSNWADQGGGVYLANMNGSVHISRDNNGDLYVLDGTIRKSTDQGINFTDTGYTYPSNMYTMIRANNGDLVGGGFDDKIYKSTDGGATWDSGNAITSGGSQGIVDILKLTNGDLLALEYEQGIFKSVDNGNTWNQILVGNLSAWGMCEAPDGTLFATSTTTIIKSTDGGLTWNLSWQAPTTPRSIVAYPDGTILFSTNYSDGGNIYYSIDGGNTFNTLATVPCNNGRGGITYVTINMLNLSAVGQNGKFYKSLDSGITWDNGILLSAPLSGIVKLNNNNLIALASGGIHRSADDGTAWDFISISANFLNDIIQLSNGTILATGAIPVFEQPNDGGVFKSTDNGLTWDDGTVIDSGKNMTGIVQLNDGSILVADGDYSILYKSLDNGSTWSIYGTTPVQKLIQLSNGWLLGTHAGTGKVHKSINGGLNWDAGILVENAGLSGITQLSNGDIWTVSLITNKVYKSMDNGATWDTGTVMLAGSGLHKIIEIN